MQFKQALTYNIILKSINILILFLSNIIFARIIGADTTGDFFYLITILSFITLIVSCSLETGITFYASKDPKNIRSYAGLFIYISLLQIILSFIIITLTVNNKTSLPTTYLLIFVISNILVSGFSGLYISRKWFISVNVVLVAVSTITFFSLLVIQHKPTFTSANNAEKIYILSFALQAISLIIIFIFKIGIRQWQIPSINVLKKIFKYSFLALIGNISFFLVMRLDYVFVKLFCTSQALGNYVQVSKMGQLFVLLPTMAASVIFPFTINSNENVLIKVQWLCRLMTLIIIAVSFFIIIFGRWLFPWFFGNDFNLMYPAMLLYLPGIFGLCISSLLASYISAKGSIGINVTASAIALFIVITGDVFFIPKYGINAAAAVSSMAYVACMFFLLMHFIKKYDSKISTLFSFSFAEFKTYFLSVINNYKVN